MLPRPLTPPHPQLPTGFVRISQPTRIRIGGRPPPRGYANDQEITQHIFPIKKQLALTRKSMKTKLLSRSQNKF